MRIPGATWGVLALLLGAAACLARGPDRLPLTLDNQHYFFIAERAASGVPPHVSHFDPKNQAGMLLSALAIRAGRGVGMPDVVSARVASIAAAAGSVGLAWAVAHCVSGSLLAGHLAALAMLSFGGFLQMGAMGARPKVFLVFFLLAAGWAVCRRRAFLAGLLAGLAFLCWQPALLTLVAAMAVLALTPQPGRALARVGLGAALPLLLYELYFVGHGALGVQLEQAYGFPARYMTHAGGEFFSHASSFFRLRGGASTESLLPLGFAAILGVFWAQLLRDPRRLPGRIGGDPGRAYLLVCGAGALAFTLYEYQTYIDGFFVIPYVAVLAGWGVAAAVERVSRGWARPFGLALRAACLLLFLGNASLLPPSSAVAAELPDQERLARQVATLLASGKVYAVGCTHLLAFNHADNHVPYGFFFRGMEPYLRHNSPEGYRPLSAGEMPDTILVSRPFVPGGRSWLESEYRDETPFDFRAQGVRVWRRITATPGAAP